MEHLMHYYVLRTLVAVSLPAPKLRRIVPADLLQLLPLGRSFAGRSPYSDDTLPPCY